MKSRKQICFNRLECVNDNIYEQLPVRYYKTTIMMNEGGSTDKQMDCDGSHSPAGYVDSQNQQL